MPEPQDQRRTSSNPGDTATERGGRGRGTAIAATAAATAAIAGTALFLDRPAIVWIREEWQIAPLQDAAQYLTEVGRSTWTFGLCALAVAVGWWIRRPRLAGGGLLIALCVAASGAMAAVLKFFVGRARPQLFDEHGHFAMSPFSIDHAWNSFPSGHSTTAAAIAGVLWVMDPPRRWLWLIAGVAVAATRVVIGAHHPSDMLAGFLLGWTIAVSLARTAPNWWPATWSQIACPIGRKTSPSPDAN